jgi:hypothetical protein
MNIWSFDYESYETCKTCLLSKMIKTLLVKEQKI